MVGSLEKSLVLEKPILGGLAACTESVGCSAVVFGGHTSNSAWTDLLTFSICGRKNGACTFEQRVEDVSTGTGHDWDDGVLGGVGVAVFLLGGLGRGIIWPGPCRGCICCFNLNSSTYSVCSADELAKPAGAVGKTDSMYEVLTGNASGMVSADMAMMRCERQYKTATKSLLLT